MCGFSETVSTMANTSLLVLVLLAVIAINSSNAFDFGTSLHGFGESIKDGLETAKDKVVDLGKTVKEKFDSVSGDDIKNKARETFNGATKSISSFATGFSDSVREFAGAGKDKAQDVADQAKDAASSVKNKAEAAAASVKDKAEKAAE